MNSWATLAAVLGALGGLGGLITAIVAWRRYGGERDNSRYDQLDQLVTQYRGMVDEYRQDAARDEGRIMQLETRYSQLEVQYGESRERDSRCREDLRSAHDKIRVLEGRVSELGG